MPKSKYNNPFRPGAGHMPPHLAGREPQFREFARILEQDVILENVVLTGLRGVGKTVLLDRFKPMAIDAGWLWVGTDLSESASLTESSIAIRMIADLSVATSSMPIGEMASHKMGFLAPDTVAKNLDYNTLEQIFNDTPGLISDKLKAVLEIAWEVIQRQGAKGVIFAYDEAQNMTDHARKEEYPLSLMLDVFQSLQKKNVTMMLLFCGLPTLFPKLVEARTFAERMFRVLFLDRLDDEASRDAIVTPVKDLPIELDDESVELAIKESGGYPYFIQFICREVYDVLLRNLSERVSMPLEEITRKLDTDFFAGRWGRVSDRQRELLKTIATLETCDSEFTIQEVVAASKNMPFKSFGASQISQMLSKLADAGLVYKNRHGRYSFAVPLMGKFILRQDD